MPTSSNFSIHSRSSASTIIYQDHANDEVGEMGAWFSSIDFSETQRVILHSRATGTGLNMLQSDNYVRWRNGALNRLWLPGIPGVGKTMTAAVVVDDLEKHFKGQNVAVISAFCDYRQRRTQTTDALISALLRQLLQSNSVISPSVVSLYTLHSTNSTYPRPDQIVGLFNTVARTFDRVYVVVDALDECADDHTRTQLTSTLFSLPISLLFTSRVDPSIDRLLDGIVRQDIYASQEDLRAYAKERLDLSHLAQSLTADAKEDILNQVVQKADGMFLLARLHMDALMSERSNKAALDTLRSVPAGVDRTYDKAIDYIYQDSDTRTQKLALSTLLWVTCARRVLMLRELQDALVVMLNPEAWFRRQGELKLPDRDSILAACAGLVVVEAQSEEVRLIHYTAHEYLAKRAKTLWPTGQYDMAFTCLSYLRSAIPVANNTEDEIAAATTSHRFFAYALREWGHHLHDSTEIELVDEVLRLIASDTNCMLSKMLTYDQMRSPKSTAWSAMHFCAHFDLKEIALHIISPYETSFKRKFRWSFKRSQQKSKDMAFLDALDEYDKSPLAVAASQGSIGLVQVLLEREKYIDIDRKDYHLRSPLSHAAERGSDEVVRLLFKRTCTDPNSRDIFGRTPLFYAVDTRRADLVSMFLNHENILPNVEDRFGRTPLSYAAQHGYSEMVQLLLDSQDVDVNQIDARRQSPLLYASMEGHDTVVRLLLKRKYVNVNLKDHKGRSSLSFASERGHRNVVSLLLAEPGIDANARDSSGRTSLSYSAHRGETEIVQSLLAQKDAVVDWKDEVGRSALSYAADQEGDGDELVSLLLNAGADSDTSDHFDRTPILYAAIRGHHKIVHLFLSHPSISLGTVRKGGRVLPYAAKHGWTSVVKCLLTQAEGADANLVNMQDDKGISALSFASMQGHLEIVKLLVACYGIHINATDAKGQTALFHAFDETVAECLMSQVGIDVNLPNSSGTSPLSHASSTGNVGIIRAMLKEQSLDVNAVDNNGLAALAYAAMHGHDSAVRLLLARPNLHLHLTDNWGQTALSHAVSHGHLSVVALLLQQMEYLPDPDNAGRTVISIAAEQGHTEIMRLFLSHPDGLLCIDEKDYNGRTPLSYAAQRGNLEVVRLLLEQPGVDPDSRDYVYSVSEYAVQRRSYTGNAILNLITDAKEQRESEREASRPAAGVPSWKEHIRALP